MRLIDGLYPFARDELSCKILREQTFHLEITVYLDGAEASSACIATTPHGFWDVVVIVGGGPAAG